MKRIMLAILLTTWATALAGCGGGGGGTSGGAASCPANGNGAHVSIGSKDFAEEILLATIAKLELERCGFTVDYSLKAADKAIGNAVQSGQIDMLWQYAGTELQTYLGLSDFPRGLDAAFAFVKDKDAARGLSWVAPAPMDDTNGVAIKASDTGKYGNTLSDFGTYLASHPDTTVCILSEFRTRADGLPGLVRTYNASYGNAHLTDIGGTAEKQIARGDCAAGEVFTTDSGIAANNLHVLTDDKNLFPPDNVGLIVRSTVLQANPAIATIMAPVAARITSDVITGLNKKVEIDNLKAADVARTWLQSQGLL